MNSSRWTIAVANHVSYYWYFYLLCNILYIYLYYGIFSYDGYSVPDRTGASQYFRPINVVAPPPIPRFPPTPPDCDTCRCLYKSALMLMVAELGRCLHP